MAGRSASRRKRNPIEGAAALSEAFHGRPAGRATEHVEEVHEHAFLADLGRLESFELEDGTVIKFDRDTRLASNEAGTQYFVVGGDQSVDLAQFDVDETKESVALGLVRKIVYETAKQHLGEEDKIPGPYEHEFGEEGGELPLLCYDTVNEKVALVGGSYHIDVDIDGKYSAGIRN